MKTLAVMTALAGATLLGTAGDAQAQCARVRIYPRITVTRPSYEFARPVTTPQVVTYGGFSHIDDLAIQMEQLAREILWEMHFNYTHNPDFEITYSEAYGILQQAKYIHDSEHRGDRAEIARVVGELDRLFHHVEDDIRTWRPSHRHFIGHSDLFGKMAAMEDTLHHLMEDVGLEASTTDPPLPRFNSDPPPPSFSALPR